MPNDVDVKLLGEHLRRIRIERKLRLRQVHDATGISIASLSRIERGGSHGLDSRTLIVLCGWMELPVEMFKEKPQLSARSKRNLERNLESTPDLLELHLRADPKLDKRTADALAMMFRAAYERFTRDDTNR